MTGTAAALLTTLAVILLAVLFVRLTLFSGDRIRRMRWRILFRLRPGPGFATLPELWFRWGRIAALHSGRRSRPELGWRRYTSRTTACAVRLGRAQFGRTAYADREIAAGTLILAPPRTGKSGQLGDRIIDHPGAVLTHETRPDHVFGTAGYRAQRGPVQVLNPGRISTVPSTFGWAMTIGCHHPAEAYYRAADLVGAVADLGDMQWWSEKARGALGAAMHAAGLKISFQEADKASRGVGAALHSAALLGGSMDDVFAWSLGASNALINEARRHPGASEALLATLVELDRPGRTADSIKMTMSKSMEWMLIPTLRDVVTGPAAVPFDVPTWIETRGTVYLISPGGDEAPTAPLFRCFASYLHRGAKRWALLCHARRLDPTVLFALDELDKCPVNLPGWLADSAGFGIEIAAVVHSTGQLRANYGDAGLNTVLSTTGLKIFLGGNHHVSTLQDISQLGGTRPGGEAMLDPDIPVNFPYRIPNWRALVFRGSQAPVVVKFRPWWKRTRNRLGLAPRMPELTPAPAANTPATYSLNGDTAPLHWPQRPAADTVPDFLASEKDADDAA
jgi:type IV secretion system protein VirD4